MKLEGRNKEKMRLTTYQGDFNKRKKKIIIIIIKWVGELVGERVQDFRVLVSG